MPTEMYENKADKNICVVQLLSTWGCGGTESGLRLMGGMYDKNRFRIIVANFGAPKELDEWWKERGATYVSFPQKAPTFGCAVNLFKLLRKERPQIVEIFGLRMNAIGRIIAKLAGVPIVISAVRQTDEWRKWYHVWLDRVTSVFVDVYVSNSKAGCEICGKREKIPKKKRMVIYNGVDLSEFHVNLSREEILQSLGIIDNKQMIFLTVARFRKEKGHDILLKAIADFRVQLNATLFLLVGDGEYLEERRQLAKNLGIGDIVRFLGRRTDVPLLLNCSDVFVLPSLYEGLPRCVSEAMAAGLPVIATNVSGTPELVEDNVTGKLVEAGNSCQLGKAMAELRKDPDLAKRLGMSGFKKAQKLFDVNVVVKKNEDLYANLVRAKCEYNSK